jgi:hypothetical protein
MNTAIPIASDTLRRQDIIEYEPLLKNALRAIVPFASYSLSFPSVMPEGLEPDPDHPFGRAALEDDRLMLPLSHGERMLAIFAARGVDPERTARDLPSLPLMASLCLEQILLRKLAITDPLTGLHNRHCLHQSLVREIAGILGMDASLPKWQLGRERRATFAATRGQNGQDVPALQRRLDNRFLVGPEVIEAKQLVQLLTRAGRTAPGTGGVVTAGVAQVVEELGDKRGQLARPLADDRDTVLLVDPGQHDRERPRGHLGAPRLF